MDDPTRAVRELNLLEEIERNPNTSQVNLATRLGVAVGTVNWHLKRLIAKGYVKVKRMERKKLRYIITPEGIALRARLTMTYIENSMALYREVREQSRQVLEQVREEGFSKVFVGGEGDVADVCRLSCFEYGLQVVEDPEENEVAVLDVQGTEIELRLPERVESS